MRQRLEIGRWLFKPRHLFFIIGVTRADFKHCEKIANAGEEFEISEGRENRIRIFY